MWLYNTQTGVPLGSVSSLLVASHRSIDGKEADGEIEGFYNVPQQLPREDVCECVGSRGHSAAGLVPNKQIPLQPEARPVPCTLQAVVK